MSMCRRKRCAAEALIFHGDHGTEFNAMQSERRHNPKMIAAEYPDPAIEFFSADIEWDVANVPVVAAGIFLGPPFDRTR